MNPVALRAGRLTIALLLWATACVVALHLLRSDLDPVGHRLSEYANGPYGYLMTTAFVALGGALLTMAVGLRCASRAQGPVADRPRDDRRARRRHDRVGHLQHGRGGPTEHDRDPSQPRVGDRVHDADPGSGDLVEDPTI